MDSTRVAAFAYVAVTLLLGVCGQLLMKWQVGKSGAFPEATADKVKFIFGLLLNPWILASVGAAFLAMLFWMAALTKLDLSVAYPFTSLSFVLVLFLSAALFGEPLTLAKIIGMALIVAGIAIGSR
jgi:multidrug transporter EmrE-like cation transporter